MVMIIGHQCEPTLSIQEEDNIEHPYAKCHVFTLMNNKSTF